ncbi:MAG: 2-C-methyl-D-erythritol 4-phosphate cytidylyltransferase [Lachnospiraceae bacterium]|nr:2-C-methyl-D-erythritol 4-phosphate cytidylyltransferase [Lachnospiraceae bacterium]
MNIALIIAGGAGERMGQDIPKQFLTVNEKPVIVYTLEAFQRHPRIDEIAVVCIEGWEQTLRAYANQFDIDKLKNVFPGGNNGQSSIRNGIFGLRNNHADDDIVLIHDAIRPMVSEEIISDCLVKTEQYGCAISVIPCAEAMLTTEDGVKSFDSFPRSNLKRTQTPQGFRLGEMVKLHEEALEKGITNSIASCTLMVELGYPVFFSMGSEKNIKLTTVEDLDIFKALLAVRRSEWLK